MFAYTFLVFILSGVLHVHDVMMRMIWNLVVLLADTRLATYMKQCLLPR